MGNRVIVISQCENFSKTSTNIFELDGVKYVKFPRLLFPYLAGVYAQSVEPDIIHLNSYLASTFFSRKNLRNRVVRHVHDVYTSMFNKYFGINIEYFGSKLEKHWTEQFDYYIVPSKSTMNRLSRIIGFNKKVWIIPNGVDTSIFRPRYDYPIRKKLGVGDSAMIIGFVGRIAFGKGALDAYLAAKPYLRTRQDVYLAYVGPSDTLSTSGQVSALKSIIKRSVHDGVSSKVLFLPPLSDVELASFYSAVEVLLLPSMSEGFGLSVLEAAACGTPSIVYDSGSLPELVGNGESGIVVRRGDVNGLTAALEKFIENPAFKKELEAKCILKAKKFDWNRVVEETNAVYMNIMLNS